MEKIIKSCRREWSVVLKCSLHRRDGASQIRSEPMNLLNYIIKTQLTKKPNQEVINIKQQQTMHLPKIRGLELKKAMQNTCCIKYLTCSRRQRVENN